MVSHIISVGSRRNIHIIFKKCHDMIIFLSYNCSISHMLNSNWYPFYSLKPGIKVRLGWCKLFVCLCIVQYMVFRENNWLLISKIICCICIYFQKMLSVHTPKPKIFPIPKSRPIEDKERSWQILQQPSQYSWLSSSPLSQVSTTLITSR